MMILRSGSEFYSRHSREREREPIMDCGVDIVERIKEGNRIT